MPAKDNKIFLRRKLLYYLLIQRSSLGRHIYKPWLCIFTKLAYYGHYAVVNGLSLHNHTRSAAVGLIVNPAVLVKGIVPYIVAVYLNKTRLPAPAHNAFTKYSLAHFGEKGSNINPHLLPPRPRTARAAGGLQFSPPQYPFPAAPRELQET